MISVPVFGGGVVLTGSPETRRADELSKIDNLDITPRGQLVMPSNISDFHDAVHTDVTDPDNPVDHPFVPIYGVEAVGHPSEPLIIAVGDYDTDSYIFVAPVSFADPPGTWQATTGAATNPIAGSVVTFASFPFQNPAGKAMNLTLVAIASREWLTTGASRSLWVVSHDPSTDVTDIQPIQKYDALATGLLGEVFWGGGSPADDGATLSPRGVVAYNNHAFIWGFNIKASLGFFDGPNRLMFSNIGNPLKWGFDAQAQAIADGAPEVVRVFEDSDAIEIGGSGEGIRCGYVYRGRLWIGTNVQLHYVEGYGRESFKTNGAIGIAKSRNVIGPHGMIEGPDGLLYGVSDEGLWRTAGAEVDAIGDVLYDFEDRSAGYWDLIWSDPTASDASLPGLTNQDLVWMHSERAENAQRVWVVIPYCDAAAGFGAGTDTVIIKYNTKTGGFSRQVFPGVALLYGSPITRQGNASAQQFVAVNGSSGTNIQRYGFKATTDAAAALPPDEPEFTIGPYAPFGADGVGVVARKYLSLAWRSGALPLVFSVTLTVDGQAFPSMTVSIRATAPGGPADGDIWVDTGGTDTNLGNGTAGAFTPANAADYQFRTWVASWNKWAKIPGGGYQGGRLTVPVAFPPHRGTFFTFDVACTTKSAQFQIEQFGDKPVPVKEAA